MQDEVEVEGPCKEKETDAHGVRSTLFFSDLFTFIFAITGRKQPPEDMGQTRTQQRARVIYVISLRLLNRLSAKSIRSQQGIHLKLVQHTNTAK